jgi:nucleoside-diphosphate-sugar epimerase
MVQTIIGLSSYPELEPLILNEVKNEIQDQYLASDKAGRLLGWEPEFDLERGLRLTLQWYADFLGARQE